MLREYLVSMLVGICGILMLFCVINQSIQPVKKKSLFFMSLFAMGEVIADKLATMYNIAQNPMEMNIAKVAKFFGYALFLAIIFAFNQYIKEFFPRERLKIVDRILFFAAGMLVVSQFTNMYYSFTENGYERGKWYIVSYIFPISALLIQLFIIIMFRKNIRKRMLLPMFLFILVPMGASVFQIIMHDRSMTNASIVAMIVLLYCFSIMDTDMMLKVAHQNELRSLEEKERTSNLMMEELTSALVEAIDAKDSYTQGHSRRVSEYSVMIAQRAGKSEKECEEIRFIALLHDVGKIGIPSSIINKTGRLTDEEFEIMKRHPIIGRDILDKITISPNLRVGASYHHERYDGKGYPFGLKGEEIPEIARIIGVADAYDAMTSKRSYRDSLPQAVVRAELEKNIGKQFDPDFARYMIYIVDADTEYNLRQK